MTSTPHDPAQLVGSWRLISFELRDETGARSHPWGPDVSGINTYTADGYLSEQFGSAHRPELALDDWVGASPDEIDGAARHYFAYAGTYEIDGGELVYYLDVSLMPNWVGKVERRFWSIEGDTLTITTPLLPVGGKQQVAKLVLRRMERPDRS